MELREANARVQQGEPLSVSEAREVFAQTLAQSFAQPSDSEELCSFLTNLAHRGESIEEITGAAQALLSAMIPFEHDCEEALDTCGTGGDGLGTFNLSTTSALVAASAGAKIIKHGNRSVSSRCGSADLLEAAGLALELSPHQASQLFEQSGLVFLYAPAFHPGMRAVAQVRRKLGIRTIFNLIGPLCNPGRVKRHLLGVADPQRLCDYAAVLGHLGLSHAYVVHGAGGADELTLAGPNQVAVVGQAAAHSFDAADLGLESAGVQALQGGGPRENLEILRALLQGERGPIFDAVVQNASAALVLADRASTPLAGVEMARHALLSGQTKDFFERWIQSSHAILKETTP